VAEINPKDKALIGFTKVYQEDAIAFIVCR